MGNDDWLAILYLLKRPEVRVTAVTVTGTGLAHAGPGARNALDLVALAGQPDIPVAAGRETPLATDHVFPAEWRAGVDALQGLSLPPNPQPLSSLSAVDLFTAVLQDSPVKVTVLALGPLTNLAEALQMTPSLKDNIEAIYYMGGAVDVEGNIASSNVGINNRFAEWNIYCDPRAASIVFRSGIPIILIPLDATNFVPATTNFYSRIKARHTTPEATFVFDTLTQYSKYLDAGGFYFWDPLAAALLTDETLAQYEWRALSVVEDEGLESGRLIADPSGPVIRFARSPDTGRFEAVFLDTLNAP